MAFAIPTNVTVGSVLTASRYNDDVVANFTALGGPWTSYTPTLTQSVEVTKTVTYAKYVQTGNFVWVQVNLTATGAGTGNNAITVSLPVAASATAGVSGAAFVLDANINSYVGTARGLTTTTVGFFQNQGGGTAIGQSPNFALANTDIIQFSAFYEAA
jgi:hypothetical protein